MRLVVSTKVRFVGESAFAVSDGASMRLRVVSKMSAAGASAVVLVTDYATVETCENRIRRYFSSAGVAQVCLDLQPGISHLYGPSLGLTGLVGEARKLVGDFSQVEGRLVVEAQEFDGEDMQGVPADVE